MSSSFVEGGLETCVPPLPPPTHTHTFHSHPQNCPPSPAAATCLAFMAPPPATCTAEAKSPTPRKREWDALTACGTTQWRVSAEDMAHIACAPAQGPRNCFGAPSAATPQPYVAAFSLGAHAGLNEHFPQRHVVLCAGGLSTLPNGPT